MPSPIPRQAGESAGVDGEAEDSCPPVLPSRYRPASQTEQLQYWTCPQPSTVILQITVDMWCPYVMYQVSIHYYHWLTIN